MTRNSFRTAFLVGFSAFRRSSLLGCTVSLNVQRLNSIGKSRIE